MRVESPVPGLRGALNNCKSLPDSNISIDRGAMYKDAHGDLAQPRAGVSKRQFAPFLLPHLPFSWKNRRKNLF